MNMTDTRQFIDGIGRQNFNLLGEIISWSLPYNTVVPFTTLVQALQASGLDDKVAREMRNRHAFARAAKDLTQDRIIRCTKDEDHQMLFQFTKEYLAGEHYNYQYETTLRLDKDTGRIDSPEGTVDSHALVAEAQRLLEKAKAERLTADISRIIMTLFEKQADLFPVRTAGGVYFVPEQHIHFVEKIEQFIAHVNGTLTRFPVPAGTKQGNKSVKDAVQQGLQALIEEHLKAVDEFGTDTRPSTLERQARKIEETKFKIENYALYLEDQKDQLNASLATVSLTLKQKLEEVLKYRADKQRTTGQQELAL